MLFISARDTHILLLFIQLERRSLDKDADEYEAGKPRQPNYLSVHFINQSALFIIWD